MAGLLTRTGIVQSPRGAKRAIKSIFGAQQQIVKTEPEPDSRDSLLTATMMEELIKQEKEKRKTLRTVAVESVEDAPVLPGGVRAWRNELVAHSVFAGCLSDMCVWHAMVCAFCRNAEEAAQAARVARWRADVGGYEYPAAGSHLEWQRHQPADSLVSTSHGDGGNDDECDEQLHRFFGGSFGFRTQQHVATDSQERLGTERLADHDRPRQPAAAAQVDGQRPPRDAASAAAAEPTAPAFDSARGPGAVALASAVDCRMQREPHNAAGADRQLHQDTLERQRPHAGVVARPRARWREAQEQAIDSRRRCDRTIEEGRSSAKAKPVSANKRTNERTKC